VRARTLYSRPIRSKSTLKNTRLTTQIILALLLLKHVLSVLVLNANDGLDGVGDTEDSRVDSVSDRCREVETWLSCEGANRAKGRVLWRAL
jgi:hypothetical protein